MPGSLGRRGKTAGKKDQGSRGVKRERLGDAGHERFLRMVSLFVLDGVQ